MQKILPGVTQKLFWNEGAEELITSTIVEDIKKCVEQAIVDGHTDNVVIKSSEFPSNFELSTGRASVVGWFFIEKIRFPSERRVVARYGECRPLKENTIDDSCAADQKTSTIPAPKPADQAK